MKHQVLEIKDISDSAFLLRLERNNLLFEPGQYVSIGTPYSEERRDYSIYSAAHDNYLEILIKLIKDGEVSQELHQCSIGDELEVEGPQGKFTIPFNQIQKKLLFVANGTGVAPFHSFIKSNPNLDYTMIHGVKFPEQLYGGDVFQKERYIRCLSSSPDGDFQGRVTDYLIQNPVDPETSCLLCGSSDMIFEVYKILELQGVPRERISAEVYY